MISRGVLNDWNQPIDETHARHALVDHEYRGELPAAHDRRRRNGQRASRRPAKSRLAELAGSKARRIGQRDLDEKRARICIHRPADLSHRARDRDGPGPEEDRDAVAGSNLAEA
jgi:hypothetical protein